MNWHIETDFISLAATILLLIYQIRLHPKKSGDEMARSFCLCIWVCAAVTLIDIFASMMMNHPESRFFYHFWMTLYFVTIVQCILSWFFFSASILYADDPKEKKKVYVLATVPYAVYVMIVLSNPWTGLIYSLGPKMEYARGPLFFLMVLIFAGYMLVLVMLTLLRQQHISKRYSAHVLLMIPIVLAAAIAVQLLNYGWLIIMPGYMLCLLTAFLFLQSKEISEQKQIIAHLSTEASVDKLTGVLNRAGMEICLRGVFSGARRARCLLIIADVDNLKTINDTLGHEGGDQALIAVSQRLKNHFRETDIVSRFGGDEFVVCCPGNWNEEQAKRTVRQLSGEMQRIPIGNFGKTVNTSLGASWGEISEKGVMELFHQADEALYTVKRNGKSGYALYREEPK